MLLNHNIMILLGKIREEKENICSHFLITQIFTEYVSYDWYSMGL